MISPSQKEISMKTFLVTLLVAFLAFNVSPLNAGKKIVLEKIKNDPENIYVLLQHIYISRRLERIADHVTNIAEDVIYLISGDIVRHGEEV
jgi:hypothetical protein